jgi:single-strand DNA-binding protein
MNLVILKGRLVRDPEVRYSNGEQPLAIANFTVACNRIKKNDGNNTADFINCVAFGKQGEFAEKYLHKGIEVAIRGSWQTGSFTNKDGNKVYTNNCCVESIEFCGNKAENTNNSAPQEDTGFMNLPGNIDDEVPFN